MADEECDILQANYQLKDLILQQNSERSKESEADQHKIESLQREIDAISERIRKQFERRASLEEAPTTPIETKEKNKVSKFFKVRQLTKQDSSETKKTLPHQTSVHDDGDCRGLGVQIRPPPASQAPIVPPSPTPAARKKKSSVGTILENEELIRRLIESGKTEAEADDLVQKLYTASPSYLFTFTVQEVKKGEVEHNKQRLQINTDEQTIAILGRGRVNKQRYFSEIRSFAKLADTRILLECTDGERWELELVDSEMGGEFLSVLRTTEQIAESTSWIYQGVLKKKSPLGWTLKEARLEDGYFMYKDKNDSGPYKSYINLNNDNIHIEEMSDFGFRIVSRISRKKYEFRQPDADINLFKAWLEHLRMNKKPRAESMADEKMRVQRLMRDIQEYWEDLKVDCSDARSVSQMDILLTQLYNLVVPESIEDLTPISRTSTIGQDEVFQYPSSPALHQRTSVHPTELPVPTPRRISSNSASLGQMTSPEDWVQPEQLIFSPNEDTAIRSPSSVFTRELEITSDNDEPCEDEPTADDGANCSQQVPEQTAEKEDIYDELPKAEDQSHDDLVQSCGKPTLKNSPMNESPQATSAPPPPPIEPHSASTFSAAPAPPPPLPGDAAMLPWFKRPKPTMRVLEVKPVNSAAVKGSIFEIPNPAIPEEQSTKLWEMFKLQNAPTNTKSTKETPASTSNATSLILDDKRARNLELFMKSQPLGPDNECFLEQFFQMDDINEQERFLSSLKTILPSEAEIQRQLSAPPANMTLVGRQMLNLCKIPFLLKKVDIMRCVFEIDDQAKLIAMNIETTKFCCQDLLTNTNFHNTLKTALQIANFICEKNHRNVSRGFVIAETLSKLGNTRSTLKPDFSLLDFLVQTQASCDRRALDFVDEMKFRSVDYLFSEEWKSSQKRISKKDAFSNLSAPVKMLSTLLTEANDHIVHIRRNNPSVSDERFLKEAEKRLQQDCAFKIITLEESIRELNALYKKTLRKLAQDEHTDPGQLFRAVSDFVVAVKASKEGQGINQQQQIKQAHKEKMLVADLHMALKARGAPPPPAAAQS